MVGGVASIGGNTSRLSRKFLEGGVGRSREWGVGSREREVESGEWGVF